MKQTDFSKRLTQALDLRGLSAADLSRATGVSEGTISCYKKGKYQAKQNRVYDFAKALRVDPAWLMGYDVPMEPHGQNAPAKPTIPPGFMPMPEMAQVPLVGRIACGTPITAEQNVEQIVSIPAAWRATFTLMCKGDSMAPRIQDGDLVAVRSQPEVENGEIAAVRIGEEATLKHVYKYPNYIELRPENPEFASIIKIGAEMADVVIEGKAVGLCRGI